MIRYQKITIIKTSRVPVGNINQELQFFGNSLGLFTERDKDRSCFRVFVEMIKAARQDQALSSDEIADRTQLTRGTVVHHLNRLMESGIVVNEGRRYFLRVRRLDFLIDELERDMERAFEDLKKVASDIDRWVGL